MKIKSRSCSVAGLLATILMLSMLFTSAYSAISWAGSTMNPVFEGAPELFAWGSSKSVIRAQLGEPNNQEKTGTKNTYIYFKDKNKEIRYTFENDRLVEAGSMLFSASSTKTALKEYSRLFNIATEAFCKDCDSLMLGTGQTILQSGVNDLLPNESNTRSLSNGATWRADWNMDDYNCLLTLKKSGSSAFTIYVQYNPSGKTAEDLQQQALETKTAAMQQSLRASLSKTLGFIPWGSAKSIVTTTLGAPTNETKDKSAVKINYINKDQTGLEYHFENNDLMMIMSVERTNLTKDELLAWYSQTLLDLQAQHNSASEGYFGKEEETTLQKLPYSPLMISIEATFETRDELSLIWYSGNNKITMLLLKNDIDAYSCFLFYEPVV